MWTWIIIGVVCYAAYKYFTRKSGGDKSSVEPPATSNPLERERLDNIQQAKDKVYQDCFSRLTDLIPRAYKNNENECFTLVSVDTTSIKLDRDTIHKILTKASYDALQNVGLKAREAPSLTERAERWRITVTWSFL